VKVAVITDDGETISQHFGRAPYYAVFTVEEGQIVAKELRDKMGHRQFVHQEAHGEDTESGTRHGTGPAAHDRHTSMAAAIADCEALLCRGMGWGAYQSMKQFNITPVVTDIPDMEEAVMAYVDGTIVDHVDRLH
jgi:predicted Fe-Mo cluster-binding NifX family protein